MIQARLRRAKPCVAMQTAAWWSAARVGVTANTQTPTSLSELQRGGLGEDNRPKANRRKAERSLAIYREVT